MNKLGRNDKCHCGSGKKYKKCCLEKDKQATPLDLQVTPASFDHLLSYEEVKVMSTNEIISKLRNMGIPFTQEEFLHDINNSYSAEDISESWFRDYSLKIKGKDEDFPWMAAWILWERLAPEGYLSMEQMNDLIEDGFDDMAKNDPRSACDHWLKVWNALKDRKEPQVTDLEHLEKHYNGAFSVNNLCQDLEMELHNAGLEDSTYFEKRIEYCREFCGLFPDEKELTIHNMRRAIADSYEILGQYKQAEAEYERIVQDFPHNPWGYVAWGDMYLFGQRKDYQRAQTLYEKGVAIAVDKSDKDALKERLEGVLKKI